jgi:aldose sugar dehydrogenase
LRPRFSVGLPVLITLALLYTTFLQTTNYAKGDVNEQLEPAGSFPIVHDPKLKVETVFEGLHFPTSMAFLGPADILVTEKNDGTVQRIKSWKMQHNPILDVDVATRHSRGILGISVAKNNETKISNGHDHWYVFVYFTRSTEPKDTNGARVEKSGGNVLYRYELKHSKLVDPLLLLKLEPKKHPDHNGGSIKIGPDKNIYIPVGDGGNDTTETQNVIDGGPPNGSGGILRITQKGSSVQNKSGNVPIISKYYYAYGIRNSFGLDFDPVSGKLWDTENGPTFGDEINLVEPGFNSGWVKIQGIWKTDFEPGEGPEKGRIATKESLGLVDFGVYGKYSAPEFTWSTTVAPTALVFLTTEKIGHEYKNDMFVSDIKYGNIYHFKLNNERTGFILNGSIADKVADYDQEMNQFIFGTGFGGITDMEIGPDGYLYVLSFGKGMLYRISPK